MRNIPIGSRALLTIKEVQDLLGCGVTCITKMIKSGEFPQPIKMPNNCGKSGKRFFRYAEIMEWIDNLKLGKHRQYPVGEIILARRAHQWRENKSQHLQRIKRTLTIKEQQAGET